MSEPKMQPIFLGVLAPTLRRPAYGSTGKRKRAAGQFTVTGDGRARVLIEMKRLSRTDFWQGLRNQTPIYMRGQEVKRAIFLTGRWTRPLCRGPTRPMARGLGCGW